MDAYKAKCYRLVQVIGLRLHPRCQVQGCQHRAISMHHVFGRSNQATAFNLEAVMAVCLTHHALAHAEPMKFEVIAKECLKGQYEPLFRLSNTTVHWHDKEYREIAAALEGLAVLTD
jgi:hypothetical protein